MAHRPVSLRNALVFCSYGFLACLLTYPLVFVDLRSHVVGDLGDSLLNSYILAWDIQKITHLSPAHFFDASLFYPYKLVLAYSENLISTALLLTLPIYCATKNLMAAYNLTLLAGFVLSAFFMYLLAHHLTLRVVPSFMAGLLYAFAPFKFSQLGHIQIITSMWLPLLVLSLHRFFETGRYKNIALAALFFLLNASANSYYMMFSGVWMVAMSAAFWKSVGGRKSMGGLLLFLVLTIPPVLFLFYPYFELNHLMGFKRSIGESIHYSATLKSYLSVPPKNWVYGDRLPAGEEDSLFVGFTSMVLLAYFFRRRRAIAMLDKRPNFYVKMALISSVLSFGPFFLKCKWLPNIFYLPLYYLVPGFNGLRVPCRIHILTLMALAVLLAYSLSFLGKRSRLLSIAAVGMMFLEFINVPLTMAPLPNEGRVPEAYAWLKQQKGDFAVAELPLPSDGSFEKTGKEYLRLYYNTYYGKSLFNGWSGYLSPLYEAAMKDYGLPKVLALWKAINIRYIVLHKDEYSNAREAQNAINLIAKEDIVHCRTAFEAGEVVIYELMDGDPAFDLNKTSLKDYRWEFALQKEAGGPRYEWGTIRNIGNKPAILLCRNDLELVFLNAKAREIGRNKIRFIPRQNAFLLPGETGNFKYRRFGIPQGTDKTILLQDKMRLGEI